LAALGALSACQPTAQVGLVNAQAVTPNYIVPPAYAHDVIANGYESCPKNGEVDPLPGRYPPCPGQVGAKRPTVATVP
jgi:hypothetical protein